MGEKGCGMIEMTRKDFTQGIAALSATAVSGSLFGQSHEATGDADLDLRQSEIDAVTPRDFIDYYSPGLELGDAALSAAVAHKEGDAATGLRENVHDGPVVAKTVVVKYDSLCRFEHGIVRLSVCKGTENYSLYSHEI